MIKEAIIKLSKNLQEKSRSLVYAWDISPFAKLLAEPYLMQKN